MQVRIPTRAVRVWDWLDERLPMVVYSALMAAALAAFLWRPSVAMAPLVAAASSLLTLAYCSRRLRQVTAERDAALRKQGELSHDLAQARRRLAETAPTLGLPYIREAAHRE